MTTKDTSDQLEPLKTQLLAAAAEFKADAAGIAELMEALADDVERATTEPLTVVPVAHHSPSSALHALELLRARAPRVIFIELCADMQEKVAELKDCKLPIALQAFASSSEAFPEQWAPLSVVAPLTEFSAEYQAIAYALSHKNVDLVFVDRSVDQIFSWAKDEEAMGLEALTPDHDEEDEEDEDAMMHAGAVGLELGSMVPSFDAFREFLLQNARVSHFSEWWDLYVEQPTLGASFESWRHTMILVGSLIRRMGTTEAHLAEHRMRESVMWTRMKTWLVEHSVAPEQAIYICGAAHAASDVPEYGTARLGAADDPLYPTEASSGTEWLYGFIPSSFSAIEHQFAHPRGTLSLAEGTWKKGLAASSLKPFSLNAKTKPTRTPKGKKGIVADEEEIDLFGVVTLPPTLIAQDKALLLKWCTDIVALARKHRYLASTADAIAIYETSVLLAGMRGRKHPSPYDFIDAAVTCLEKMEVPGRRSVAQMCGMMLGADRVGQVGYSSLPPLVQDVYDRLAPIGVKPKKTTITRALMDFRKGDVDVIGPCSALLWRLNYLLPSAGVARPIMGEKKLGGKQVQESWDIKTAGAQQRAIIQLAYEGVTIEQVLEQRLKRAAHRPGATASKVLELAEDAILYLDAPRLSADLGARAVELLVTDMAAQDARAIFERVRRFVHHYRATPGGLPEWLSRFVEAGYQHYATLLPNAFADRGCNPDQLAGMLAFLFALESLALAMGCNRSQVLIAIEQSAALTTDPPKLGLLWASEWILNMRSDEGMREEFDEILSNPMSLAAFPEYLSGFLLALHFTSRVAQLAVELISRAFADLPDAILMPWLPNLVTSLDGFGRDALPALFKEAFVTLPSTLPALDAWEPAWTVAASADLVEVATQARELVLSDEERLCRDLLFRRPATTDALAHAAGQPSVWRRSAELPTADPSRPALSEAEQMTRALLLQHRETSEALAHASGVELVWDEAASAGGPAPASALSAEEATVKALLERFGATLMGFDTA